MSWNWTELERRFADFDRLPAPALGGPVRDALAGQRILLSGATGFVGGWLTAAVGWLNARTGADVRVIGVSRRAPVGAPGWFTPLVADVRDAGTAPAAEFVIHAAMSSERAPAGGDAAIADTARQGTAWALDAARRAQRALILSSGAVATSTDAYAVAKRESEEATQRAATTGTRVSVARLFTCIGPGYRAHGHLAHVSLFTDAVRGGPLTLRGDGASVRSYLYGADVASWLLRILVLGASGETVDVGSDVAITVRELAGRIATRAGLGADAVRTGTASEQLGRDRYLPDYGAAHTRLGLAPWTSLDDAIDRTLELMRADGR